MVDDISGSVETLMWVGAFHHVGPRELGVFADF